MENLERLKIVPMELLKAKNVAYVVIDGMQLPKHLLIEKAQRDAAEVLKHKDFLSKESIIYLNTILKL